ncbi:MAG: 5-formyltetrahydrofolate cyclo-ligase [Micrococcales bacterium]|nr:5-formyltetrahydrofolate cyclo-ligase [Micrococcales bacterium]
MNVPRTDRPPRPESGDHEISTPYEHSHVLDEEEVEDLKDRWRRKVRQARKQRSVRARAAGAQAVAELVVQLPEVLAAHCVAAYAARPDEPETAPLLDALAARGVRVLLPLLSPGLRRDWAVYAGQDDLRERAPGRPPEPSGPPLGEAALADADVHLVPALAVDTTGTRLGQGGGWYDRVLRGARPGTPVIAVTNADEVYDAATAPLPRAPHDLPVHAVVTPAGITWFHRPDAA